MKEGPSGRQVLAATEAFLLALRREWVKLNPEREECPIPVFADLPAEAKGAFLRAQKVALVAGSAERQVG